MAMVQYIYSFNSVFSGNPRLHVLYSHIHFHDAIMDNLTTRYIGQKFYADNITMLFGVVYTSWPIVVFAVFDRDITPAGALAFPQLYRDGVNRVFMNSTRYDP